MGAVLRGRSHSNIEPAAAQPPRPLIAQLRARSRLWKPAGKQAGHCRPCAALGGCAAPGGTLGLIQDQQRAPADGSMVPPALRAPFPAPGRQSSGRGQRAAAQPPRKAPRTPWGGGETGIPTDRAVIPPSSHCLGSLSTLHKANPQVGC